MSRRQWPAVQCLSFCSSGRAAHAPKWDGESGYRLHISPLNPRTSRRDIEKLFGKFGSINEVRTSAQARRSSKPIGLGLDGDESSLLRLRQLQTPRRRRRSSAINGWKVSVASHGLSPLTTALGCR